MKNIKVIYNPSSGRQAVQNKLNQIIIFLLEKGYTVSKFSTQKKNDAKEEAIKSCKGGWDLIIACGGDGTINEVAEGVAISEKKIPIALYAAGTVNDFANYLALPKEPMEFVNMIEEAKLLKIDLGKTNNNYFVNVAAGGLLTNIAHKADYEMKTLFGKLAYYFEGIKEFPKQRNSIMELKITSDEFEYNGKVLLFLISNSQSIGGVKKAAPKAEVADGYLDCIIVKNPEIQDVIDILFNIQNGSHINNNQVEYFKTKSIKIESLNENNPEVDLDGEFGGYLPQEFCVVQEVIDIFIP